MKKQRFSLRMIGEEAGKGLDNKFFPFFHSTLVSPKRNSNIRTIILWYERVCVCFNVPHKSVQTTGAGFIGVHEK